MPRDEVSYDFFREQLANSNISEVEFVDRTHLVGKFKNPPTDLVKRPVGSKGTEQVVERKLKPDFLVYLSPLVGENLDELLLSKGVVVKAQRATDGAGMLLAAYLIGFALMIGLVLVHVPPRSRPVHGRRHPGRLQQEPGQALRDRRTSRSRSPTWPGWKA